MKVKINRVRGGSRTGDQRDYGLVTGSIWNYENKPTTNTVSTTLSAVPRDEANLEAENGETVVGDLDSDGTIEHAKIGGKRHYEGGTPLNIPDGSFIFSDTNALKIKNKDVLKNIFNINSGKSGLTPAAVAKNYEINKYKDILQDPLADPMSKKTAQMMIDNNMKKLGQLALVQEGMKGFPDGIPAIALPLMGSDMGQSSQPQQEPGMAKHGGLHKAQTGGRSNYENLKGQYDTWRKNWDNALKTNNVAALKNLRDQGTKLQSVLNSVDIPNSLPLNLSWLYPSRTELAWGTQQGKLTDAADIIGNMLDYENKMTEKAHTAAESYKNAYAAKNKFNELKTKAQTIIDDFNTKGGSSQYTADQFKNAQRILNGGFSSKFLLPNPEIGLNKLNINSNNHEAVATMLPYLNKLETNYPLDAPRKSANKKGSFQDNTDASEAATLAALDKNKSNIVTVKGEASPEQTKKKSTKSSQSSPVPVTSSSDEYAPEGSTPLEEGDTGYALGGELEKAQLGNSGVRYDISDKKLRELAKSKKYKVIRPEYFNRRADIGPQLPGRNPKEYVRAASGEILPIHGMANPETKTKYKSIDDFISYADPYINFGDYDSKNNDKQTGISNWKADLSSKDASVRKKAGDFFVSRTNAYNKAILGSDAPETIDTSKPGYWEMGVENLNVPFFVKDETSDTPVTTTNTPQNTNALTEMGAIPDAVYEQGYEQAPWYRQDVANYYNTLNNYASVRRPGDPSLYQLNPYMPDPTFVDPARAIAQQQGALRAAQEAIMSGSDPSVGRANVIASQAAGADPIANIMSGYNERNVGIANQFGVNKAQVFNNALAKNAELRKAYEDEREVAAQQYANALREARNSVTGAYIQGETNRDIATSANVQNPNYSFDPLSGKYYFKRGYDPRTGAPIDDQMSAGELFNHYIKNYNLTPDQAIELITGTRQKSKNGYGAEPAQFGGMYNPMDILWNNK